MKNSFNTQNKFQTIGVKVFKIIMKTLINHSYFNLNKHLSMMIKNKENFKGEKLFSLKGHTETLYSLFLMNNL